MRAHRSLRPPVVDGIIAEDEWGPSIAAGDWLSYNPLLTGDRVPQVTTVWLTYDADYLYIAFKCDDPEPVGDQDLGHAPRQHRAGRLGRVSLDALGTGQTSYHMMVNPSGVQLDMLNSAAGDEDSAPDWFWDSAGRLTDTGYAVEIRLPLQSIRFKGGRDLRMGLLFFRRVSRLGVSVSWPAIAVRHVGLRSSCLAVLRPTATAAVRELLPSATFARNETRESPEALGRPPSQHRGRYSAPRSA